MKGRTQRGRCRKRLVQRNMKERVQRGINIQHACLRKIESNELDGELGSEIEWSARRRQMELVKSLSRVLYQSWQRDRDNSWAVSCRFHKQDKLMILPRPLTYTVCFYCLSRGGNGNLQKENKKKPSAKYLLFHSPRFSPRHHGWVAAFDGIVSCEWFVLGKGFFFIFYTPVILRTNEK